jgi:hypothetical protein
MVMWVKNMSRILEDLIVIVGTLFWIIGGGEIKKQMRSTKGVKKDAAT